MSRPYKHKKANLNKYTQYGINPKYYGLQATRFPKSIKTQYCNIHEEWYPWLEPSDEVTFTLRRSSAVGKGTGCVESFNPPPHLGPELVQAEIIPPALGPSDMDAFPAPGLGPLNTSASIVIPNQGPGNLGSSIKAPAQGPEGLRDADVCIPDTSFTFPAGTGSPRYSTPYPTVRIIESWNASTIESGKEYPLVQVQVADGVMTNMKLANTLAGEQWVSPIQSGAVRGVDWVICTPGTSPGSTSIPAAGPANISSQILVPQAGPQSVTSSFVPWGDENWSDSFCYETTFPLNSAGKRTFYKQSDTWIFAARADGVPPNIPEFPLYKSNDNYYIFAVVHWFPTLSTPLIQLSWYMNLNAGDPRVSLVSFGSVTKKYGPSDFGDIINRGLEVEHANVSIIHGGGECS